MPERYYFGRMPEKQPPQKLFVIHCAKCKSPMVKFSIEVDDDGESAVYARCLKCLTVEKMKL
jgi:RNase P subunit RPR2